MKWIEIGREKLTGKNVHKYNFTCMIDICSLVVISSDGLIGMNVAHI